MSWDTAFDALMNDTVVVASLDSFSTDGYGTPVWGTATTYTARVVREQTMVRTFEGTEELATVTAWLKSTATFGPTARYTFPTSTGAALTLLAVDAYPDEDGVHHVKLRFG
jgi:hypothetical protein